MNKSERVEIQRRIVDQHINDESNMAKSQVAHKQYKQNNSTFMDFMPFCVRI